MRGEGAGGHFGDGCVVFWGSVLMLSTHYGVVVRERGGLSQDVKLQQNIAWRVKSSWSEDDP